MDECCLVDQNSILLNISLISKQIHKKEDLKNLDHLNEILAVDNQNQIFINNYVSNEKIGEENSFVSNLIFWEDIEKIIKKAFFMKKDERLDFVKKKFEEISERLPANVYIPFKRSLLFNFNFMLNF